MWFLACFPDPEPAEGIDLPSIVVDTQSLDFGRILPGESRKKTFEISNTGPGELYLGLPEVIGGNDSFSVEALEKTSLLTDESEKITVVFTPDIALDATALLRLPSNDPLLPSLEVSLMGSSKENALWFEPGLIEFGTLLLECEAIRTVELVNNGESPITVDTVTLEGSHFTVDLLEAQNGPLPWTIEPSLRYPLSVRMDNTEVGSFAAALTAETSDTLASATLSGTRLLSAHVEDTFDIDGGKVDIIIPVQAAEQYTDTEAFTSGLPDFLDALDGYGVDYQIAVVMQNDGCVFGSDPFFSSQMSRDQQLDIYGVQIDGTEWAHGLVVTMEAVKTDNTGSGGCNQGLLRPDAKLAVIAFTFVGENHPDLGWMGAVNQIVAAKGDLEDVKIHGIIEDLYNGCGGGSHSFWSEAVNYTGGVWFSICDDIPTSMLGIVPELVQPPTTFLLSQIPDPATISVTLDGDPVQSWTYNDEENLVEVASDLSGGTELTISYEIPQTCE